MGRYSVKSLLDLVLVLILLFASTDGAVSDGKCEGEGCRQDTAPGSVMGQVSRLQSGGLDGAVNRIDLSSFPNHKEPGTTIDIIRRIAADSDYKGFGTLLLENGDEMDILKHKYGSDSVEIITGAFNIWIQGKSGPTSVTWRTLVKCLRDRKMNTLADDIEKFFSIAPPKAVPSLWRGDEQRYITVTQLLKDVHLSVDVVQSSSIGKAEDKMTEVAQELTQLENRLQDNRVRVGIIGLTKAGKSTFLNALLGKSFLPTSFDPQTANETVIIHDMSKRDGELHCFLEEKSMRLASGHDAIFDQLTVFNKEKRGEGRTQQRCDKLILYAPLQFLVESNMTDVKLELSDTPGFGEAGAKNITDAVIKAVKEMCAFILIINSNNMKSKTELAFLNNLTFHHPGVFEDLNRILVLVNGHTSVYKEGKLFAKSASISPEDLPEYVSDYFKSPEGQYEGVNIPKEKITVFHALWALQSREWRTTKADTKSKEMKIFYSEAVLMLRYINRDKEADALERDSTDEQTVNEAISVLEEFSQILTIENMLKEKVVDNGGAILLESAVDDTRSVITHSILPAITDLIRDENLEAKQAELQFIKDIDKRFTDILSEGMSAFDRLASSISSASQEPISTHSSGVKKAMDAVLSKKLTSELRDLVQIENKADVLSKMRQVRDNIPSASLEEMKTIWPTLSNAIRSTATEQVRRVFADIKTSFLSSLSGIDTTSALQELVKDLRADIPATLDSVGENSHGLVPHTAALAIDHLSFTQSKAVEDEGLDRYIQTGKKTKYRQEYFKTCDGGFLGTGIGKDCDKHMRSVPYEVPVYAPMIDTFNSAFESIVQAWTNEFEKQAKTSLNEVTKATISAGKEKLQTVLSRPHQRVKERVESCRTAFEKSENNVAFLREQAEELGKTKELLKSSL